MMVQAEKRKAALKWIIVAEVIVCYMAVLTVVSYARGPVRYETAGEPILTSERFVSFDGALAGYVLPLNNDAEGTAACCMWNFITMRPDMTARSRSMR